jgi:sterol desaturase/sphingolipid hydroxylase (fatty acid hydroxylase superfamily)
MDHMHLPPTIHHAVAYILGHTVVFGLLLFAFRMAVCTVLERLQPARPVAYRKVIWRDVGATLAFGLAIAPAAIFVNRWLSFQPTFSRGLTELPLAVRFFMYLVTADFGHYWIHRLMHTQAVWRVHKWHHAPTYMYWLAGVRGSLLQQILVNVPYIFAEGIIKLSPGWVGLAILVKNSLQNDWMHLNVRWGARWLEWLIVTPRYHHIHHSDDPSHYRANLASLLPIWDRIFGTYVDPDKVPKNLTFGIGERVPAIRFAVGV